MGKKLGPPNWRKWKQIPEWSVFQAVALSLNLEPKKMLAAADQDEDFPFPKGQAFEERLEILHSNIGHGTLQARIVSIVNRNDTTIIATEFVAWARRSEWNAPAALFSIGSDNKHVTERSAPTVAKDAEKRAEQSQGIAAYLDPNHPRYSRKLAAAIHAWEAVTDAGGAPPKRRLTEWLEKNACELGLHNRDGTLNKLGIQDCAKVANWQTEGGAPKTPTR